MAWSRWLNVPQLNRQSLRAPSGTQLPFRWPQLSQDGFGYWWVSSSGFSFFHNDGNSLSSHACDYSHLKVETSVRNGQGGHGQIIAVSLARAVLYHCATSKSPPLTCEEAMLSLTLALVVLDLALEVGARMFGLLAQNVDFRQQCIGPSDFPAEVGPAILCCSSVHENQASAHTATQLH